MLKQKHKILNLDDAEDGNLINTSDEDKTTDEEEKALSYFCDTTALYDITLKYLETLGMSGFARPIIFE